MATSTVLCHIGIIASTTKLEHLLCFVQVVWNGYVTSMLQAGFTSNLVLYAASGLLTYGANDGMSLTNAFTAIVVRLCVY